MNELRVYLRGECAALGTVPAADVARLMLVIEKAVAQAAAVVLGQPKTTTGRYKGSVEEAVHFRLRTVEKGSVVVVLELPEPAAAHGTLDFEVATLGQSAVAMLLDAAAVPSAPPHPLVAKALLEVANTMRLGDRYDELQFDAATTGRAARHVRVDAVARKRLREYVDSVPVSFMRSDAVTGVLVEADFEKRTARLRTPTEPGVEVQFSEDLEDEIYAALRHPATLRGDVAYDPRTHSAKTVRLRRVDRGEQLILGLDPTEYWAEPSFEDLARRQGSGQPADPRSLYDAEATDEERNAFMAVIAELE
jgi:hypothetical protein